MPRETDEGGFEVKREFIVRRGLHLGDAQGGNSWRWWIHCYRNGRYTGGAPYNKADALVRVERLLTDGWTISDRATTAVAILELTEEEGTR